MGKSAQGVAEACEAKGANVRVVDDKTVGISFGESITQADVMALVRLPGRCQAWRYGPSCGDRLRFRVRRLTRPGSLGSHLPDVHESAALPKTTAFLDAEAGVTFFAGDECVFHPRRTGGRFRGRRPTS